MNDRLDPSPSSSDQRLENYFKTHAEHEGLLAIRERGLFVVAASSVGLAPLVEWPDAFSQGTRNGILAIWAIALAATLVCSVFVMRARSQLQRLSAPTTMAGRAESRPPHSETVNAELDERRT